MGWASCVNRIDRAEGMGIDFIINYPVVAPWKLASYENQDGVVNMHTNEF